MTLVQRLAERYMAQADAGVVIGANDARWWLNAIAEEIDAHSWSLGTAEQTAHWLREQARENT